MSLLLNMSTVMVFSIFGLYLYNKIGANLNKIGFFDGAVESISFVIRVLSGILSDYLMNRKILLCIGVSFLFIAKPLEAIATSFWGLFQAKVLERLGNGIHSSPRDAMVGDFAPPNAKGSCYGIRQTMAAFGSVLGAIIAFFLLKYSNEDYQFVFWMASIPSFIGLCIAILYIKDKKNPQTFNKKKITVRKISVKDIRNLGPQYWTLIVVAATYMVSKVTESIVILYVIQSLKLPNYIGPLCMICFQFSNSFTSYPIGIISDRIKKRENVFIFGIIVFLLSDVLFLYGNSTITMIIALLLFGSYIAVSQTVFPAKIIDIVPSHLKGTAIGIFNFICAISLLVGGSFIGYISDKYNIKTAFLVSSCLGTISLLTLFVAKRLFFSKKLTIN